MDGQDIQSTDFFRNAMQGSDFVSKVRLNPDTGKPVFVIASPIEPATGG